MNPLTDEESYKQSIEDQQMIEQLQSLCTLMRKSGYEGLAVGYEKIITRFRKLTQPEQVRWEPNKPTEEQIVLQIMEAVWKIAGYDNIAGQDDPELYIPDSKLRHAIQTALNGKIDKR